jgi:hypothetical protein
MAAPPKELLFVWAVFQLYSQMQEFFHAPTAQDRLVSICTRD